MQRRDDQADHAHMQTGCKPAALRENQHLSVVASDMVAAPQRGFVRRRRIEECIVGFDGAYRELEEREGCGRHRR